MKKIAFLAIVAAMPAMAGTPAPVVTVPVPTVTNTSATATATSPAAATSVAPSTPGFAFELAGVYNFASRDLADVAKHVDTYGFDVTGAYSLDANNAITFRMGYAYGSEVLRVWGGSSREQVENFTIMPGYRFTHAFNDSTSVFAGANVGAARMRVDVRNTDEDGSFSDNDSDWGFAYSAEVGVKQKICDNVSVFAAYQFSGNTAKPAEREVHQQTYHGIRAGLSINF